MTTPRDDIAGLSERLREPRMGDPVELACHLDDLALEAAAQLDALQARVKEYDTAYDDLMKAKEAFRAEAHRNAERALCAEQERDHFKNKAHEYFGMYDKAQARNEATQQERDALEAERDDWRKRYWEAVKKHIECCGANATRALRAEQERDEAYERAAKVADSVADIWNADGCLLEYTSVTIAAECEGIATAIRRLAAGPEKEG